MWRLLPIQNFFRINSYVYRATIVAKTGGENNNSRTWKV